MVWRTAYSTATAVDAVPPSTSVVRLDGGDPVPLASPGIWIVGFGLGSLRSVEVWLRLCRTDLSACAPFRVAMVGLADELANLPDLIPPSRRRDTYVSPATDAWADWVGPAKPDVLAAVSGGAVWPIVMAGLPTEEAWEAFVVVAQRQAASG
ncbi:MAG: hypothetical protein SNJ74_05155 [Fimbriimonadaceae bacterium]